MAPEPEIPSNGQRSDANDQNAKPPLCPQSRGAESDALSPLLPARGGPAGVSERDKRHRASAHRDAVLISASTSFFGLPRNFSTGSLRAAFNLPPASEWTIDWVSLAVVYWVVLTSEAARGLMLPSTWPYLASLGGTRALLGVFVASFSLGRMATTVPLGYLSDAWSTSTVLVIASLVQVAGHVGYAIAPNVVMLIAARVVVGFGSATMSVCRAHLTRAVPARVRTHHFAYLSALQFVGFAVLPGAGGLLARVPEFAPAPGLDFNGYTYPAWVLVGANLLAVVAIFGLYVDPPAQRPRPPPPNYGATQPASGAAASPHMEPVRGLAAATRGSTASLALIERGGDSATTASADSVALIICLLINVSFRGIVAELETVTTPFLMEHYEMDYESASYYIAVIGLLGLAVYLFFKPIARRFSDRKLVVVGLLSVLVGCVPLSLSPLTRHMSEPVYVACIASMWSIAYPVGQTAVLALFSKILGDLPAGGFLGIFSASGSLARVVFAMLAGKLWDALGREAVFACIVGYVVPALALCAWRYNRLVPAEDPALL